MLEQPLTIKFQKQELVDQFADCRTLGDVIARVESDCWRKGRVICQVKVNGMTLTEKDEAKLAAASVYELTELEFFAHQPNELLFETVSTLQELNPHLKNTGVEIAELLRSGRVRDGQRQLIHFFERCQNYSDGLSAVKKLILSQQDSPLHEKWSRCEKEFAATIREILMAYEQQDAVLLSDLLEYELSNSLDKWLELVATSSKMRATIGGRS